MKRLISVVMMSFAFLLSSSAMSEPVDINKATAEQLAHSMTGVGKVKAEAIVKDRDQNGAFKTVDELSRVKGIKASLIAKNRANLTAEPVSTATSGSVAAK